MLSSEESNARRYRFADVVVDCGNFTVQQSGQTRTMTPRAFDVLLYLLEHPGRVVEKQEMFDHVWKEGFVTDSALTQVIKEIRQALGDDAHTPRYIETVHKRGYRFMAPVEGLGRGLIESLAVLPMENLSGDPKQDYFAEGMTEALITELGKISALRVISRQSVMQFKGTEKALPEIAQQLKVDAVVEGAVVRAGARVRITAQLIRAAPEQHLWAQSYELDLRDIVALQGEVARAIAGKIMITLTPQEQVRLASAHPVDPEAYEAYLKGRYFWNKGTEEGYKKSIGYFEQATERDPGYAPAYVGLADCYIILGDSLIGMLPSREAMARAKTAAMKAVDIDPMLGEAYASLAIVTWRYHWDWLAAEKKFRRAIELNPSYGRARLWFSWYLSAMGRHDEALAEIQRARELDPLSLIIDMNVGWALYFARQYDQAIEQFRKTLELDANFPTYLPLGFTYLQKGMYQEAVETFKKLAFPISMVPSLGRAYAVSGQRGAALKVLDELTELSKRRYVPADHIAWVYIGLGEKDQAFEWLEKASEEQCSYLAFLKVDAIFDPLRDDPRFQALLRRMNFPD